VLPLDRPLLDQVTLGAAAVAVLALVIAVAAHVRVSRLRRGFAGLDGDGKDTVIDAVRRSVDDTRALRAEVAAARQEISDARRDLTDSLRHVAVVRYDAFGEMGGRLSFTAALLDDAGDGLVLTSIHGRSEARTYAKGIKSGKSEQSLSPEEQQSIDLAMRGTGERR
jgi:hypothetical protein